MSLRDAIVYDAARVLCNPGDVADPTAYDSPAVSGTVRVNALWGEIERDTEKNGTIADWAEVFVSESELTDLGVTVLPSRNERAILTRYPDDLLASEEWTVGLVSRANGLWSLLCYRNGRLGGRLPVSRPT